MIVNEVRDLVNRFVHELLPEVTTPVPDDAGLAEIGLDSMSMIDLFFKVEREFGVEVPDAAIPGITTVRELADFVAAARASAR